jgi:glycosyltransferase involved in cell wall biosynthesis
VLVQDGPVSAALAEEMRRLAEESSVPVVHVELPVNGGLASALNRGLAACSYSVVARMDADDVSEPSRFDIQIHALVDRELDIVGAGLFEFVGDIAHPSSIRIAPREGDEIRRVARFRQPFHHPTVVYRREAVLAAGGYPRDAGRFEDYVLFARMLARGVRAGNVSEPLVHYRVGAGAYARRGGLGRFRDEVRLQRELRRLRVTSRLEACRNLLIRAPYRLVPAVVRARVYRRFAAESVSPRGADE